MKFAVHGLVRGDVVDIKSALLPLVIEVHRRYRAAVERVAGLLDVLWSVDMTETVEVKVCRQKGGGVNDRLKL